MGGFVQIYTLTPFCLCYIRGRSIPNRFFILDEAQQLCPVDVMVPGPEAA